MSDRCCSKATDLLLSRRELIHRLGGGIAGIAFADLLARNGLLASTLRRASLEESPLAQAATLPRQSQGGDFDLLLRRREPGRHLRSQARSLQVPGRDHARRRRGADRDGNTGRLDAVVLEVQEARPVRHGRVGAVSARRPARRRPRPDPVDALAQPGSRPGSLPDEHRQYPRRTSERRQLGELRPRQREREPARASSCSRIIAAARSTARPTGATATCRRPTRACSSATPALRSWI